MDTERAEGIVLRRQPVTESSLLVTWYTREFGKLKTLAKGARRAKGPFQGKIDLFYRDEIVFLPSRRSDLHLLHDCYLEDAHAPLRNSVASLTAASYACELVELATEQEDPNAAIYGLLRTILHVLEGRDDELLLIWFGVRLLAAAGWKPDWETEAGTGRVLHSLANSTPEGVARVKLSDKQLGDVRCAVWQFWDAHLGRTPKTRVFLAAEAAS
ncbi:MAG TPA: DNA repair protein RecO [Verrucomicrobiae bacterium]|nr:DNA repair protein RecO [Verrucomicrobiae bacterium]